MRKPIISLDDAIINPFLMITRAVRALRHAGADDSVIRMTLRRPRVTKEYPLKQRRFQWVQEAPFNR